LYKKYLILTVGGSDAPVVNAIELIKPNFVYFICSDDTDKTRGSYTTVDESGKPCGIIKTCPNCNHQHGEMKSSIVAQTGLEKENFKIIKISQIDDLNDCYIKSGEVIQEIRKNDPAAAIIADYTGGTKSMSSGLAAAAMDDGNIQISIVKGRRLDLHKVKDGTQSARLIESSRIFLEKKLKLVEGFWSNYDFRSSLEVIAEIAGKPLSSEYYDRLDKIRYFCSGFEAWDRFDHQAALEQLKPYKNEPYLKHHSKLLSEIIRVKQWWPGESLEDPAKKSFKQRAHIYCFAPVFDLLLNAKRRVKQGRYDDAVARIYRALELFGQLNLLRWEKPLATSDLNIEFLPENLKKRFQIQEASGEKITLALMQGFFLLEELETPVGRAFDKHCKKLKLVLNKRNNSLMAHGIIPISKEDSLEAISIVENFLLGSLTELGEEKPDFELLQFPADLLKQASLI